MNEHEIEELLRKAPAKTPPAGLVERMKKDIRLRRSMGAGVGFNAGPSWLKRWLPALALASILVMCMVAVAVQTNLILELKRKNEILRTATANLETLRSANIEIQKLSTENQELDRLRKDNEELKRLRNETGQSGAQIQEAERLLAENNRIRMQLAARRTFAENNSAGESTDADKSERCVNNLKMIGISFRLWATDHEDRFPDDYLSLTNELNTWKILQCPSDTSHNVASWADVAASNVSYRRVSSGPNAREDNPYVVLVQCPIHGHILLTDGAVQRGSPELRNHLRTTNGVTVLVP